MHLSSHASAPPCLLSLNKFSLRPSSFLQKKEIEEDRERRRKEKRRDQRTNIRSLFESNIGSESEGGRASIKLKKFMQRQSDTHFHHFSNCPLISAWRDEQPQSRIATKGKKRRKGMQELDAEKNNKDPNSCTPSCTHSRITADEKKSSQTCCWKHLRAPVCLAQTSCISTPLNHDTLLAHAHVQKGDSETE
mmetsp:Transcript_195/g.465  ORF Transcript_195/g.465 Transcript_195/m.465 type:complete len:192 (+) Transcript_195:2393-2968(+)